MTSLESTENVFEPEYNDRTTKYTSKSGNFEHTKASANMFILVTVVIVLCVNSQNLTYHEAQIPTISISSYLSAIRLNDTDTQSHILSLFDEGFHRWGAVRIVDHQINSALMQNTLNGFKQFFKQNEEYKSQFSYEGKMGSPGFVPRGVENVAKYHDNSDDNDLKDDTSIGDVDEPNEAYHILSNWKDTVAMQAGNPYLPIYDDSPTEFSAYIPKYFSLMRQNVKDIHLISSKALGYADNIFEEKMIKSKGYLTHRANDYYELTDDISKMYEMRMQKGYYWRFRAHRDFASFAFVHTDNVQGFQIKANDTWYSVQQIENSLLVIAGDFIRFWTNDYWKAAVHRVVTGTKDERVSIASFSSTDLDEMIDILPDCIKCVQNGERKFDAVLGDEWLRKRINEAWDEITFDLLTETKGECT